MTGPQQGRYGQTSPLAVQGWEVQVSSSVT